MEGTEVDNPAPDVISSGAIAKLGKLGMINPILARFEMPKSASKVISGIQVKSEINNDTWF